MATSAVLAVTGAALTVAAGGAYLATYLIAVGVAAVAVGTTFTVRRVPT